MEGAEEEIKMRRQSRSELLENIQPKFTRAAWLRFPSKAAFCPERRPSYHRIHDHAAHLSLSALRRTFSFFLLRWWSSRCMR